MSNHEPNKAVTAPPEAVFGFGDFVRVVRARAGLIRLVTLAVLVATAVVMFALPTLYSTSAVVMLDQRKNAVADAATVLSSLPTDPSSVQNQIHVLASRDLALKVIEKLHLDADPEFNPALGGGQSLNPLQLLRGAPAASGPGNRDQIVSAFLSRLDVSSLGVSTSIEVTFTSKDPEKAARIANTLAESYTETLTAAKVSAARKAAGWLTERMHQLATQVQQQESAIELYKAEHDIVESQPGTSLTDQQLVAINTQLVNAQSELAEKRAAYDRVAALAKTGNGAAVTPVVSNKMIGDLRAQEAELVRQEADLASRYGPNHPKMAAIRNEKRDLAAKIDREVTGIAGSMESDLAVAKAHVGAIEASLARVSRQARQDAQSRVRLNAMQANLASTRTMYESFVQRLRAVQDQDDIQLPEAEVISTAPVPVAPSAPHRKLFIAASLPGGLLLGILLALVLERFGAPLAPRSTPERVVAPRPAMQPFQAPAMAFAGTSALSPELDRAARNFVRPRGAAPQKPAKPVVLPPVLAELAGSADMRLADWVLDNPASPYALALNTLLEALMPHRDAVGRVVAVAAPAAEASKSVALLALGRVAATRGVRTVLLDADLGRLVPASPQTGLSAYLAGQPLASLLRKDQRTHLQVMAASGPVWADPRADGLLLALKQHFDLILIDAPAPQIPGPWPKLGHLADSVVIYAPAKAAQAQLDGVLRSLVAMSVAAKGLILAA